MDSSSAYTTQPSQTGQDTLAKIAKGSLSKPSVTMTVGALEAALIAEFPLTDGEAWDRSGLSVGDPARLVEGVAVALDPTVDAIEAAADAGAHVLVTHHPLYLQPPATFAPASSVAANEGAGVWAAISRGVAVMSFHTCLDVSTKAQRVLPGMLGLRFERVCVPLPDTAGKGYGQVCSFEGSPLTLGQLAARCTSVFGRAPRVWGDISRTLERVVTCTGSLGEVGQVARAQQADCVICGEVKYHDALALSQAGLDIIEIGHDSSELPLATVLAATVESLGFSDGQVLIIDQRNNWTYPETVRV